MFVSTVYRKKQSPAPIYTPLDAWLQIKSSVEKQTGNLRMRNVPCVFSASSLAFIRASQRFWSCGQCCEGLWEPYITAAWRLYITTSDISAVLTEQRDFRSSLTSLHQMNERSTGVSFIYISSRWWLMLCQAVYWRSVRKREAWDSELLCHLLSRHSVLVPLLNTRWASSGIPHWLLFKDYH